MKSLLVIWLAAFFTAAHGYVALEGMEGGACINAKLQDNFDINKFQGVWYEAQSAPNMFQLTKKCTKMEYTWNGAVVNGTTTGLGEEDQPTIQSTDMTKSARNGARFLVKVPEMPELEVPFDILSTDYNSYACVYSCLRYENFKSEFTWALTRDNSKLTGAGAICKRAFQQNNIDVSKMVDTYHGSLCSAPPKTSRGKSRKSGLPTYRGSTQSSNKNVNTNNNSKEKKRKYNWTPNKTSWKPYTPRAKQNNNNEVNNNARTPYTGYRQGNQPAVTNIQSTTQKKTPVKPYQSVEVKTKNKGYNPYSGYRSNKQENINKPTVTNVLSTSQKKTSYKPYQSFGVKTENNGYKPFVGYRSTKGENMNKLNQNYNKLIVNTDNKVKMNTEKTDKSVKIKPEAKGQQPYVGYRGTNIVTTNKSDKPKKDSTGKVSPYKGLKSSDEETLIPANKKVYRSNWGSTYGVRRQNAWGASNKQNDDASQAEVVKKFSGYNSRKEKEKPKQKGFQPKSYKGYQSRNQRRRKWSTIESINTEVRASECADKQKSCGNWATSGECERNPVWMKTNCQKSCKQCNKSSSSSRRTDKSLSSGPSCSNKNSGCQGWSTMGECKKNPRWMNINCPKACGKCS